MILFLFLFVFINQIYYNGTLCISIFSLIKIKMHVCRIESRKVRRHYTIYDINFSRLCNVKQGCSDGNFKMKKKQLLTTFSMKTGIASATTFTIWSRWQRYGILNATTINIYCWMIYQCYSQWINHFIRLIAKASIINPKGCFIDFSCEISSRDFN